jgi:hypothetical protein
MTCLEPLYSNALEDPFFKNKQVWRMDYHKIHPKSSKDVALLPDAPFHYHVLDPWQQ